PQSGHVCLVRGRGVREIERMCRNLLLVIPLTLRMVFCYDAPTMSSDPSLMDVQYNARPLPTLAPIHVPKSSEVLASQLRVHILDGTIADGAALPAERDLVVQTGLSR